MIGNEIGLWISFGVFWLGCAAIYLGCYLINRAANCQNEACEAWQRVAREAMQTEELCVNLNLASEAFIKAVDAFNRKDFERVQVYAQIINHNIAECKRIMNGPVSPRTNADHNWRTSH